MSASGSAIGPGVVAAAVDQAIDLQRGDALGIAPLDADARVPDANLPERLAEAALLATYARVIQVVGNGTDKTAAINAALATGVAVGLTKEVRLVGEFTISAPLVIASKTKLDATGATVTLAAGSNCNMLRNTAVAATGTRDNGIEVTGGRWIRGTSSGSGINMHTMCFRRVDGLRVRPTYISVGAGKYAVNLGDVTKFEVDHIDFSTTSDGVHINGPASAGSVHHITGTTYDDSVAITGNDYAAYADVSGNVTDVMISHINTTSTVANNVKVLAGQGCTVDDIVVEHVRGTCAQNGVWLGDDNGQATTDNGTHGVLTVRDVNVSGTQASSCTVFGNLATGAKALILSDLALVVGLGTYVLNLGVDAAGVVDQLIVERPRVGDGMAGKRLVALRTTAGATVRNVVITSPRAREVSNTVLFEATPTVVNTVTITDPQVSATDTSSTNWISLASGSTVGTVTIRGGRIAGGRGVADVRCPATVVLTGGLEVSAGTNGLNRLANLYGTSAIKWVFGEVTVAATMNRYLIVNETASLTVIGTPSSVVPSTLDIIQRSAAQTVRVAGTTLSTDLQLLTPQNEDVVRAFVAKGTIAAGATAVYRGGIWKDLYAGTTYTP